MRGRRYYPDAMLKANQDAFVVRKEVAGEPDSVFFGVFDGHGSSGTDCAQFARDKVPNPDRNPSPDPAVVSADGPALAVAAAPSRAYAALSRRMPAQSWLRVRCV